MLTLLHGFTDSSHSWKPITEKLNTHGYTTHTPDIIGHGSRTNPDPTAYTMPAEAKKLAESFAETPVSEESEATEATLTTNHYSLNTLLGYSMGGRLALYTALHQPDKITHLILESASPGLRTQAERDTRIASDHTLAHFLETEGIEAFANKWTSLPLWHTQPPALKARLHTQRLQNNPRALAHSLRGMGTGTQPSLWDQLPELTIPTLLIVGEQDPKFLEINKSMRQLIPHADLVILPNVGHNTHAEAPDTYVSTITDWLSATKSVG